MTTIVYHHPSRMFFADGRETDSSGFIYTDDAQKIYELDNGDIAMFAGDVATINIFVAEYNEVELGNHQRYGEGREELGFTGFLFHKDSGKVFHIGLEWNEEDKVWVFSSCSIQYSLALGSGSYFAIAALDLGKSPSEAIEYAATRDVGTGSRVYAIQLPEVV